MKEAIKLIKNSPYIVAHVQWLHIKCELYKTIQKKNISNIVLLPHRACSLFTKKFKIDTGRNNPDLTVAIGLVGWTIWTLFDQIQDEKMLDVTHLNMFSTLRPIIDEHIGALHLSDKEKSKLIGKISMMEYAESQTNNLNVKQKYILKSLAVSVPLLSLLMSVRVEIKNIKLCQKYFHHLLGARQLSDDALDWPEDMKKGQHTLVTQWLIETIGKDRSVREYRKAFNATVSPRVARKILRHSRLSIRYARQMTCFTSTEFLEELPRFYETMAMNILNEYRVRA
ncbi:MAG: hypothetical protein PHG25_01030 [Candidatus Pacebacteria bacterium]|nr:hypothetical protein [Candidatus Paceibacterota bacterium]